MSQDIKQPADEKHKLQELVERLQERDKQIVEEMNSFFNVGMTLENRLVLANARAEDALAAVCVLARYIMEKEPK